MHFYAKLPNKHPNLEVGKKTFHTTLIEATLLYMRLWLIKLPDLQFQM